MKKAITILFLLLCLHLPVCARWDDNEASNPDHLDDIWHIAKPERYIELLDLYEKKDPKYNIDYDNLDYYMPPDGPDDYTPIDYWPRYTVGKNDAPVIKACNGNRALLRCITVYVNYRVFPDMWAADEAIRARAKERLGLEWSYNYTREHNDCENTNTD